MTASNVDIFFVISSVGFILVFCMLLVLLFYLIKAVRAWNELTEKIEKNIDSVGYAGRELIDEVRDSMAFRLLFKPKRRFKS
jgi:large-conductance mechanosensitive channel